MLAPIAVALVQTMLLPPTTLAPAGVPAGHDQLVPAAETNVSPAGRLSVIVIVPVVATAPWLYGVIVYTPLVPTLKLPLCALLTTRSDPLIGVVMVEELLPLLATSSFGSLIVAVLVTLGAAAPAAATSTVRLLASVPPATITVALVHFTSLPFTVLIGAAAVHVHPVPVGTVLIVMPAGSTSSTV